MEVNISLIDLTIFPQLNYHSTLRQLFCITNALKCCLNIKSFMRHLIYMQTFPEHKSEFFSVSFNHLDIVLFYYFEYIFIYFFIFSVFTLVLFMSVYDVYNKSI